jgi:hypothetical protein
VKFLRFKIFSILYAGYSGNHEAQAYTASRAFYTVAPWTFQMLLTVAEATMIYIFFEKFPPHFDDTITYLKTSAGKYTVSFKKLKSF